jgi:hypothetical protein
LSVNRRFGGTYRLQTSVKACGKLVTCFYASFLLSLFFTLKMEAISSETSADTQRTTRRYIPEDDTLHNHRCENLKSYIAISGVRFTLFSK